MRKLLEALNPFSPSSLHVELRGSVAHHVRQIDRARAPQVDSDAGRAIPMKLIATSGRYIGWGDYIEDISNHEETR